MTPNDERFTILLRSLGRIEGKLEHLEGLAARVVSLEKSRAYQMGGTAIIGAVIAWVATKLPLPNINL